MFLVIRKLGLTGLVLLIIATTRSSIARAALVSAPESPNTVLRFTGPFENTYWGIGGTVVIDMTTTATSVSGYINFTNDPDVGLLCGAGSFNGTRNGDDFEFSFTSNDPDPGCSVVNGTVFNVSGRFSNGEITDGQFYHPSSGQSGIFSAKQTVRYHGTFSTNGYDGTVIIDIVQNSSNLVTGYMNFTNNPGVPSLCGAGSFRGSINSNGNMVYDFLSNDPDPGCGFDAGLEFAVSANLSGNTISNGTYTVVDTGQSGVFSTACAGAMNGAGTRPNTDSCPVDNTPPTASFIWPESNQWYGYDDLVRIEVEAHDPPPCYGCGISRVEFWAQYDGVWHYIGDEFLEPYEFDWPISEGRTGPTLYSQQILLGVHVHDKAGNMGYEDSVRQIYYVEIANNPDVDGNWVPAGNRAYLNQRSLPNGDLKCGFASASMVLAMNQKIPGTYDSLSTVANKLWNKYNGWAYVWNIAKALRGYGLESNHRCVSANNAWTTIKSEINAGHPAIILSSKVVTGAHYIVVVGYRETGQDKQIIVYDSYGAWLGGTRYNKNSTSPNSRKGQWRYYDFDSVWGYGSKACPQGYIITAHPQSLSVNATNSPTSPPDLISNEPEDIVTYDGIDIADATLYLPLIWK